MRLHKSLAKVPTILATLAAISAAFSPQFLRAADPGQFTSESLVRHFLTTQYFSSEHALTAGTLGFPDAAAHARSRISFANAIFSEKDDPAEAFTSISRFTLGCAYRDTHHAAAAPQYAPFIRDHSASLSYGGTLTWRTPDHTAFFLYSDLGYQHTKSRTTFHVPPAAGTRPPFRGNWEANTLTSLIDLGLSQSFALSSCSSAASPAAADAAKIYTENPAHTWLRLRTRFGNLMQYGTTGGIPGKEHFLNVFLWTSEVELALPAGYIAGNLATLTPFFQYTEIHDDGNRSLSKDGRLFRAGFRASFIPAENLSIFSPAKKSRKSRSSSQLAPTPNLISQIFLQFSASWSRSSSGFQLSAGCPF